VDCAHFRERTVSKREGKTVEVGDNVRARIRVPIYANRPRVFVDAAADVED
jgi:hypothetical protein